MLNPRKLFFVFLIGLTSLFYLGYASADSDSLAPTQNKSARIKEGFGGVHQGVPALLEENTKGEKAIKEMADNIRTPDRPQKILDALMNLHCNPIYKVPFATSEDAQAIIQMGLECLNIGSIEVDLHIRQGIYAMLNGIDHEMGGDSFCRLFGQIPDVPGSEKWEPK